MFMLLHRLFNASLHIICIPKVIVCLFKIRLYSNCSFILKNSVIHLPNIIIDVSKIIMGLNKPRPYLYCDFIFSDSFLYLPCPLITAGKIKVRSCGILRLFYCILPKLNSISPDKISLIGGNRKRKKQEVRSKKQEKSHIPYLASCFHFMWHVRQRALLSLLITSSKCLLPKGLRHLP